MQFLVCVLQDDNLLSELQSVLDEHPENSTLNFVSTH